MGFGRELGSGIGCSDEYGFAGEGEGEVGEHGFEGLGGERDEADKKAAGGSRGEGAEVRSILVCVEAIVRCELSWFRLAVAQG